MNNKDALLFSKIIDYCNQIEQACVVFGCTKESFAGNKIFQNACCMCILQIGELAGRLTDDARAMSDIIPWPDIRAMCNICAHNYGSIDVLTTWDTISNDIPRLKEECRKALKISGAQG